MKFSRQLAILATASLLSSCALIANDKNDQITINSNPPGADIFVEGKNYGKTPATIKIEAKNQTVVLNKEGYGSAQLNLETWYSMKNAACSADALGTMLIVPSLSFFYGKCTEFKEKEYMVNIPNLARNTAPAPMVGVGNSPKNMIDYYYNQNGQNPSRSYNAQ